MTPYSEIKQRTIERMNERTTTTINAQFYRIQTQYKCIIVCTFAL